MPNPDITPAMERITRYLDKANAGDREAKEAAATPREKFHSLFNLEDNRRQLELQPHDGFWWALIATRRTRDITEYASGREPFDAITALAEKLYP